jgi:hypothetical protein
VRLSWLRSTANMWLPLLGGRSGRLTVEPNSRLQNNSANRFIMRAARCNSFLLRHLRCGTASSNESSERSSVAGPASTLHRGEHPPGRGIGPQRCARAGQVVGGCGESVGGPTIKVRAARQKAGRGMQDGVKRSRSRGCVGRRIDSGWTRPRVLPQPSVRMRSVIRRARVSSSGVGGNPTRCRTGTKPAGRVGAAGSVRSAVPVESAPRRARELEPP